MTDRLKVHIPEELPRMDLGEMEIAFKVQHSAAARTGTKTDFLIYSNAAAALANRIEKTKAAIELANSKAMLPLIPEPA